MFGWFKKKGTPIVEGTILKKFSGEALDWTGELLKCDSEDHLLNVWCSNKVMWTKNEVGELGSREILTQMRSNADELRILVHKNQLEAYYVSPEKCQLEFHLRNGRLVKLFGTLNPYANSKFCEWIKSRVKKPGQNLMAEDVCKLFDKCFNSKADINELMHVEEYDEQEVVEAPPPPPPQESVSDLKPGSVVFGRYHIEKELGQGGMGKVFLATDSETTIESRRKVVLKVLHMENAGDAKAQEQFQKEADTLADLLNDRIAACYNSRIYGDSSVLVMEYVEGEELSRYLSRQGGRIDEKKAQELLLPIAEALDYAHGKGVFHLDVKPQNIIVRRQPKGSIQTCLLDFGIARRKHFDGSVTTTSSVSGTLLYMSPDQLLNEKPSAAMDVYSLAVTAYECVTGGMPYPQGWNRSDIVPPIQSNTLFAKSIMKGLDSDPKNRPVDCVKLINPPPPPPPKPPKPPKTTVVVDDEDRKPTVVVATKPPPKKTVTPPPPPPVDEWSLLQLPIRHYREMLNKSAMKIDPSGSQSEVAEWMRTCQKRLAVLQKNQALGKDVEQALVELFEEVRARIGAADSSPEAFFPATDRLVELRSSLAKVAGGRVLKALKDSVQ